MRLDHLSFGYCQIYRSDRYPGTRKTCPGHQFYLSEMSAIALESGGTIDKFIGDGPFFFGDPDSEGEREDALKCIEMGLRMKKGSKNCENTGKNLEWQMEFPSGWGLQRAFVLLEFRLRPSSRLYCTWQSSESWASWNPWQNPIVC